MPARFRLVRASKERRLKILQDRGKAEVSASVSMSTPIKQESDTRCSPPHADAHDRSSSPSLLRSPRQLQRPAVAGIVTARSSAGSHTQRDMFVSPVTVSDTPGSYSSNGSGSARAAPPMIPPPIRTLEPAPPQQLSHLSPPWMPSHLPQSHQSSVSISVPSASSERRHSLQHLPQRPMLLPAPTPLHQPVTYSVSSSQAQQAPPPPPPVPGMHPMLIETSPMFVMPSINPSRPPHRRAPSDDLDIDSLMEADALPTENRARARSDPIPATVLSPPPGLIATQQGSAPALLQHATSSHSSVHSRKESLNLDEFLAADAQTLGSLGDEPMFATLPFFRNLHNRKPSGELPTVRLDTDLTSPSPLAFTAKQ